MKMAYLPLALIIASLCGTGLLSGCSSSSSSVELAPTPVPTPDPEPEPNPDLAIPQPNLAAISEGIVVYSPEQLDSMIEDAQAGDVIRLANGIWHNIDLTISRSGTAEDPIVLAAQTAGAVHFSGTNKLRITGDHVRIDGLVWQDVTPISSDGMLIVEGEYNIISNNTIFGDAVDYNLNCQGYDNKWVSLEGQYHQVISNRFEGKCGKGVLLTVWRQPNKTDHHLISHNIFKDYVPTGSDTNGFEGIRIGTSTDSQSDSFTIVQYNLFEGMDGEIEIISSKSGGNHYHHNTFRNSNGLLTLRHGKNNIVEHNLFLQADSDQGGGIRIYDSGHRIHNNYITSVDTSSSSRGGIVIHAGLNEQGTEPSYNKNDNELNKQWTANSLTISNNTVYNSDHGIYHNANLDSSSACENGDNKDVTCQSAWDVQFKNNLVYHSGGQAIELAKNKPVINASYSNERYWGSNGSGLTAAGIDNSKPTLNQQNNLITVTGVGADLQQLLPLTEQDVGPSYSAQPQ